jgi:hypothetical protein
VCCVVVRVSEVSWVEGGRGAHRRDCIKNVERQQCCHSSFGCHVADVAPWIPLRCAWVVLMVPSLLSCCGVVVVGALQCGGCSCVVVVLSCGGDGQRSTSSFITWLPRHR